MMTCKKGRTGNHPGAGSIVSIVLGMCMMMLVSTCVRYAEVPGENLRDRLTVPRIFSDNMVLQRGKKVSIWGWATPGDPVSVRIGDEEWHGLV